VIRAFLANSIARKKETLEVCVALKRLGERAGSLVSNRIDCERDCRKSKEKSSHQLIIHGKQNKVLSFQEEETDSPS